MMSESFADNSDVLTRIIDGVAEQGYVVLPDALSAELVAELYGVAVERSGSFNRAGVGRQSDYQLNAGIRGDAIEWLEADAGPMSAYLDWAEQLRLSVNRSLFLGLFDYEAHFAHYPPGAAYERHVDAFKGRSNRVLTTVLYLNSQWDAQDGGQLLIYPESGDSPMERVLPLASTLVVFLSDRFPHEVLAAKSERFSIAGWYRMNTSGSDRVDPPR